jgi:hypothetical protein
MAFTSRAPRLQTSADRYYRFFDEGQQIGVDLVVRFENALMQKYDPGKPAIMASCPLSLSETPYSWRTGANRAMLLPDGPTAQIALWCAHWTVPVQRAA